MAKKRKFQTARDTESSKSAVTSLKEGSSTRADVKELLVNDDEDEDIFQTEYAPSASEDEGESDDERKHQKLLEAIGALDGKKKRKLAERSEASSQVSEFALSSEGAGEKIELSDLLHTICSSTPSLSSVKNQLKVLQGKEKTLDLPLSRQETEKIQRTVAYEKTSKEVDRWSHVVIQNRKAEKLVFPLNEEPVTVKPVEQILTNWKPKSPLEEEIFNLLHKNKQPITNPLLNPFEKDSLYAMSLEEMKIRRAELQKARALQSYYETKAKRQKKIKSKKYHKVKKKAKQKEVLKDFEEMRKTNPDAALEELKKLEFSRMKERMSLKHQNSGKWAKSKAIMAKYDEEARKEMQEQLEMNKQLTQKLEVVSESEEEDNAEDVEVLPDFVNDAQVNVDPANPWMLGKLSSDLTDSAPKENESSNIQESPAAPAEESEAEEDEEDIILREFEEKRSLRRDANIIVVADADENQDGSHQMQGKYYEEDEEKRASEFNSLFKRLIENQSTTLKEVKTNSVFKSQKTEDIQSLQEETEEAPFLNESTTRARTMEDIEVLVREEVVETTFPVASASPLVVDVEAEQNKMDKTDGTKKQIIDPKNVLNMQSKVIHMPTAPLAIEDEEGEDQQKMIIKEAFASDDVIGDFLKDKKKQITADKPKDVNLVLPGWGEWGGVGLKPSAKKRRRFKIKVPPGPPRKDKALPNVIISEKRNPSLAAHQVADLPYPFENPSQFERTIRCPIGSAWNTQRSFQKLTAPKVTTKMGAIIDPISEDALDKNDENATKNPVADIKTADKRHKTANNQKKKYQKNKGQKHECKKKKKKATQSKSNV
ncbi:U3 small nucleolar RNA-associated protein 14 homolog A isoform X1 [Polypterus senegalus]|uniref:U3 small nucleolar RNA-associated protein 14 homolog A isoform X1 n=1 Tax=Polypterus senegalus TaxID=55291 RepID=UPI001965028D|nr:U3 small nucleolar RNA-associated protein 14 homolog A isoform X1 [Polypterus senegalus]